MVEVDHTSDMDFVAKLTSWTHKVPEDDIANMANEFASEAGGVVSELMDIESL